MKIKTVNGANLWDLRERNPQQNAVVVTINTCHKKNGDAVMGAGIAKEAAILFPTLPSLLGKCLRDSPNKHVWYWVENNLFLLVTKLDWRYPSNMNLLRTSLTAMSNIILPNDNLNILMPKIGCGLGGLNWNEVKPLIYCILEPVKTNSELWLIE